MKRLFYLLIAIIFSACASDVRPDDKEVASYYKVKVTYTDSKVDTLYVESSFEPYTRQDDGMNCLYAQSSTSNYEEAVSCYIRHAERVKE